MTSSATIIAAAQRALAERGQGKLTISAVAQAAGVSRPTVYRWFPTKEDLLRALAELEERQFGQGLQAVIDAQRTPARRLDAALRYLVTYLDDARVPDPTGVDPAFMLRNLAEGLETQVDTFARGARARARRSPGRASQGSVPGTGRRAVPPARLLPLPAAPPRRREAPRRHTELRRRGPSARHRSNGLNHAPRRSRRRRRQEHGRVDDHPVRADAGSPGFNRGRRPPSRATGGRAGATARTPPAAPPWPGGPCRRSTRCRATVARRAERRG